MTGSYPALPVVGHTFTYPQSKSPVCFVSVNFMPSGSDSTLTCAVCARYSLSVTWIVNVPAVRPYLETVTVFSPTHDVSKPVRSDDATAEFFVDPPLYVTVTVRPVGSKAVFCT